MAQHDYVIANGTGAAVRSDLNNALAAIVSNNSGATEPATMYAYQWWADTSTGLLKLRNAANNAWITLRELDGTLTIEAGTVSAPGLAFASDLNTGVWSPGADQFAIATNGVERVEWGTSEVVFNDGGTNYDFRVEGDTNANLLFVDASADAVGIGTSSPGAKLQVNQNTDSATALSVVSASGNTGLTSDFASLFLQNTNTTNNNYNTIGFINDQGGYSAGIHGIYTSHTAGSQSGAIAFGTSNAGSYTEKVRITATGAVGIGTTTPGSALDVSLANNAYIYARENGTNQTAGYQIVANGGTPTAVFSSNTATGEVRLGGIATNYFQTFYTSNAERGRFDASGRFLVGTSSGTYQLQVEASSQVGYFHHTGSGDTIGMIMRHGRGLSGFAGKMVSMQRNDGTEVGSIVIGESSTLFNTSSDYRLKENFTAVIDGIVRLKQLKPGRFNFIVNPGRIVDGFIAHEVQAVVPEAIHGSKDEVDADGNPVYQGIDQSKLVPLLTAALQEAIGRIETLEAEVTALKAQ